MPKNMFQRPQQVAHKSNVPRHGAPIPLRKVEARRLPPGKQEAAPPLPSLEALLRGTRH